MREETIAAIATPLGVGGVGMVRISGPDARLIADRVFCSRRGNVRDAEGYTALYGRIGFPAENQQRERQWIDEAVALVFAAPASFTGEDVVELSVHGGVYLIRQTLRAVLDAGARLAQPGEFTRRAFLNGKMDLAQAESIMQLIGAQGEDALRAALSGREGALSRRVQGIRDGLLAIAAAMAVWADYPDEDVPALETQALAGELSNARQGLHDLLSTYDRGRILHEGIQTVIVGRPNVGKSTLMNLLAGGQRSIVTSVPGTTRDIVEEDVMLGNVRLRLADTAGLRDTDDLVESIGVQRTRQRMETAGLILAVFDASQALDQEDDALLSLLSGRPAVAVVNKTDLPVRLELRAIEQAGAPVVLVSAGTGKGAAELAEAVESAVGLSALDPAAGMLANERQRDCIQASLEAVEEALSALADGSTLDAIGICLDDALSALLSLTGERVTNAVTDEVFRRFCVGK